MASNYTTMTVRLTDETKSIIKDLAQKQASTPSQVTRHLIESFCAEYAKNQRYSDVA